MTDRKFFSGLPDRMMRGHGNGQNRQQTNFFWPNDNDQEHFIPSRNRLRNRTSSTASLMSQSQASTDTEESRRRRSQANQSKIQFYDMVDCTDNESVYSRVNDSIMHKKQETLKSRIEFNDFVDPQHQNFDDDVQSVIERPVTQKVGAAVSVPVQSNATMTSEKSNESLKAKNEQQNYNESLTQDMQNMSLGVEFKNGFAQSSQVEKNQNLIM